MTCDDDDLMFEEEGVVETPKAMPSALRWKMLVVDDEREVHSITRLVLADFCFKGRAPQFFSAYSAAEAIEILERESDIAVILLDVVMETEDAGLRLVRHILDVMKNRHIRIILRTGQPGQAPERSVILDYDINDYKSKTQLTAQQLFTCMVAALRSYEDLTTIEINRRGLEKIIEAASSLSKIRSMKLFAAGVLTQLSAIVGAGPDAILCVQRGDIRRADRDGLYVLAGSGRFGQLINEPLDAHVEPRVAEEVRRCLLNRQNIFDPAYAAIYIHTSGDRENVVYLSSDRPLDALDQNLIELFCDKISVGFENIYSYEQALSAQEATVATLANLGNAAHLDTTAKAGDLGHPGRQRRLATLAEGIARCLYQQSLFRHIIDEPFLGLIGMASVLHDLGNIAVPEGILSKPGPLTEPERQIMQSHTLSGSKILGGAGQAIEGLNYLGLGAIIARSHHENFDGTGYPERLAGEQIPLAARIVAVADSYDAMISDRPYRPALSREAATTEIRALAGRRFDPAIVEAFRKVIATQQASL